MVARDSHRTLELLEEISNDQRVTQRSLSSQLGISLGIANLYLKRLAKKGYIKMTTVPGQRLLRYMLTPQGLSEKSRLTYEFAAYSYRFLRSARSHMCSEFERLKQAGLRRVVLCGTGELAELAYLAMAESGLELAGVVAAPVVSPAGGRIERKEPRHHFLGRQVLPFAALGGLQFDGVVAFSEEERAAVAPHVPGGKELVVLTPGPAV
jgi:DNA-binding MarR family transcriptional regulator